MNDARDLLEQSRTSVPINDFDLETFHRRRERREARRRLAAGGVALSIAALLVVLVLTAFPKGAEGPIRVPGNGEIDIRAANTGEYYVWSAARYDIPPGAWNLREVRWNEDGMGALTYESHGRPNQSAPRAVFEEGDGPHADFESSFEAFGYYSEAHVPTDPTAALAALLERSAEGGASPQPHETPSPGTQLTADQYDVLRAVNDLTGADSDEFLATPAQVSSMMQVLAALPGATATDAQDPAGRPAVRLAIQDGELTRYWYVDPSTYILLAAGGTTPDLGDFTSLVVLESGFVDALDGPVVEPLIPSASPRDVGFGDQPEPMAALPDKDSPVTPRELATAMEGVREQLMSDCFSEQEARELISSVLDRLGVTGWEIRTDGPLGYPVEERDAVLNHLAEGCFVYSGSGGSSEGAPIYFIYGPET